AAGARSRKSPWRGALKPPSWAFMIPSRRAWIFRGWSSQTRRCGGRWTTRDTGRYNSGPMNAGTKFAIGAVLIVGSVGYLMAPGVKQTGQYFLTPTELTQKIAADTYFYDVGMKGRIDRDFLRELRGR